MSRIRWARWSALPLALTASAVLAQGTPTPAPTPAPPPALSVVPPPPPAPPPTPLTGIRNKLAAGDLLSAESVLEVWKAQHGEEGLYLTGLSWLGRGALLMNDFDKAHRYAADVRARCADSLAHAPLDSTAYVEYALGSAIEVEAQVLAHTKGDKAAADYMRGEIAKFHSPPSFVSRLHKRLNLLTLVGTEAPELVAEDFVGTQPPSLASLRGKPVLLFLWAATCGDCRAQEATLARIRSAHAKDGLQVLALTRYYEDEVAKRTTEKALVDSVWKTAYKEMGPTPIVLSTASMEHYGGSSTPTFVFVDRKGIVRGYTPTRLTVAEFEHWLAPILK